MAIGPLSYLKYGYQNIISRCNREIAKSHPMKLLMEKGVDIREGDRYRMTPLMIAARYGRLANIKQIFSTGMDDIERKNLLSLKSKEG